MDILFNSVNKAWLASAYPHSKVCTSAASKHTTRDVLSNGGSGSGSGSGVNGSRSTVSADWSCSYCAGKIRVISISGGSLDTLVHASITRLDGLAPAPRNLTRERLTPANANSNTRFFSTYAAPFVKYLSPVHLLTGVVKTILSMAGMNMSVGNHGNVSHTSNATVEAAGVKVAVKTTVVGNGEKEKDETGVEVDSSSSCALDGTCVNPGQPSSSLSTDHDDGTSGELAAAVDANTNTDNQKENNKVKPSSPPPQSPSQTFLTMTMKQWYDDMSLFQEPRHISLLTTQLTDVGFPVDHKVSNKTFS